MFGGFDAHVAGEQHGFEFFVQAFVDFAAAEYAGQRFGHFVARFAQALFQAGRPAACFCGLFFGSLFFCRPVFNGWCFFCRRFLFRLLFCMPHFGWLFLGGLCFRRLFFFFCGFLFGRFFRRFVFIFGMEAV